MKRLIMVGCFMYTCLSITYNHLLRGMDKIILLPVLFVFVSIFWFMSKTIFFDWLKKNKKEQNKKKGKIKTNNYNTKYYENTVKPYYENGKNLYNHMLKSGYVKGDDLKSIYELVFDEIGENWTFYEDYEFKSTPHKTYVLMKDRNITVEGWERIIDHLNEIKEREDKIQIPQSYLKIVK